MSAHKYELMFIADPDLDERALKKLTEQYLETVTKEGGAVEEPDFWGRRKLAYEIDGKTEGNYVVVNYSAEPAVSAELDRILNLNESVIRTKILRKDAK
ncbi:30S ribosomal protein S6 [Bifidobacterium aemilianum]|uniref:Small ribosomal subunit protein bS6 n=1 Tax=Bifidobacterium aemilianum TaxID=2493120 RepID=A0A366K9T4_9BIFI|nr:30S ribosomal protein S6 [Bifidobacterium aemilianum]RBP97928.1 30S ribosomal protein S6 [Bifidobacterium aemilianum]